MLTTPRMPLLSPKGEAHRKNPLYKISFPFERKKAIENSKLGAFKSNGGANNYKTSRASFNSSSKKRSKFPTSPGLIDL